MNPQRQTPGRTRLLAHLHRHMQRHGHPDVFMTLMLLLLDVESSTAEFAVAGPPSPLLCRGGRSSPLTADFGWTLGYPFGGVPFHSENLALLSGDVLLFYTDGLSDAARGPDPERDSLGVDGLGTILADVCADWCERHRRRSVRGRGRLSRRMAGRRRRHGAGRPHPLGVNVACGTLRLRFAA